MAKNTVEQSLVLDVLDFARKGHLVEGASGTRRWVRGDQDAGGIGWQVAGGAVYLRYTNRRSAANSPPSPQLKQKCLHLAFCSGRIWSKPRFHIGTRFTQ